jgi:beta-lactamase regulating signal transducer with metallopeptidase domain
MSSLQTYAQFATSQIVNCFVLGLAFAAVAGTLSATVGRKSSTIRFAIWFAAMLAMASSVLGVKPLENGAAAGHVTSFALSLRPEWAQYIFGSWALLALIGTGRVLRGLWRVRALKKSCVPVNAEQLASLTAAIAPSSRRFRICASERIHVPAALGFFHPAIVLPTWTLRDLSPEELHTVVLHEAAHLDRWDDWTNLLQKIIRALLFFHPAVWWIDSRLSVEREISCDDVVLVRSTSARQYAACLVSLAEKTYARRSLALVQAAVGHLRHTAKRVSKILDGHARTNKPLLKPAVAAITAFGAMAFVAVQHAPQLVSFKGASTVQRASMDSFGPIPSLPLQRAGAQVTAAAVRGNKLVSSVQHRSAQHKTNVMVHREGDTRAPAREQWTLPVQARQQNSSNPLIVNANMAANMTPGYAYLVAQTEQHDAFGNVTLTTYVWRITVVKHSPAQAQTGVLPHQT